MDPKNPTPTPQPDNGLIMPEPTTSSEPVAPAPTSPVTAEPTPAPVPVSTPPQPETDPLFAPVTEPDPLDVEPAPVAPNPTPPVTDQAMNRLDDSASKGPVVVSTGQTVVAASKPHKSRKKTMIILVIGLLLVAAAGFTAYTYFMKPKVEETATPAAILSVDKLSPEDLTQSTETTELKAGSQTNAKVLVFSGKAPTDAPSGLKLQIEIQPLGTDFTGTPIDDTVAIPDEEDSLKVKVTDYSPGSYHWRARLSDGTNNGPWVAYNTTDEAGKTADFTIDRTAPAAATLKTVNGKTVASKIFTSTVAQLVFTGTTEAGSTVSVAFNESTVYKATVASDGMWTMTATTAVPNGKYTVTVTTTDAAGNAVTSTYTVTQSAK